MTRRPQHRLRQARPRHDDVDTPGAAGVCGVRVETRLPAERQALAGWEQKHATPLPADLRSFYLATDGLKVGWDYRVTPAGEKFELGCTEIRPLAQLSRLGGGRHSSEDALSLLDPPPAAGEPPLSPLPPRFNARWLIFELDKCGSDGVVCLVCARGETGSVTPAPSIWLLDSGCRWHWLAGSFLAYFRMTMAHLSLPQWQLKYTPDGTSLWAKTWMTLIGPHLLAPGTQAGCDNFWSFPPSRVDPAVFRTKSKSRKDRDEKNEVDDAKT